MKHLFEEDDHYSELAAEIEHELVQAIKPILHKYAAEGYSLRELAHIANGAVMILECETILRRKFKGTN